MAQHTAALILTCFSSLMLSDITTMSTVKGTEPTLASESIVVLIAPLAGGIIAVILVIVIVLVIIVICLHNINMKRKHIVRDIQLDIAR